MAALSAPPGRLVLHPTPAKPRKLGRKPALVSSPVEIGQPAWRWTQPERTGLAACRHLFISYYPSSAALHSSQGRSVDQAPPRSGPAPPTVP